MPFHSVSTLPVPQRTLLEIASSPPGMPIPSLPSLKPIPLTFRLSPILIHTEYHILWTLALIYNLHASTFPKMKSLLSRQPFFLFSVLDPFFRGLVHRSTCSSGIYTILLSHTTQHQRDEQILPLCSLFVNHRHRPRMSGVSL
jgi:hypothetical protein